MWSIRLQQNKDSLKEVMSHIEQHLHTLVAPRD
jgi:hypothetical protein